MPVALSALVVVILAYLIGSIPVGLVIVKIATGRDIRKIESGRTGGTNAMRAAGLWAGILTAVGDVLKGYLSFWLVNWFMPADHPWTVWVRVLAPIAAIIGHNYSILLMERNAEGRLRLRGGAGGATCFGGSLSLWPPIGLIILPVGLVMFFIVGYASVTTISVAVTSILVFGYLAVTQGSPWQYVLYGIVSLALLLWALRPNLARLAKGTERLVGVRAWLKKRNSTMNTTFQ